MGIYAVVPSKGGVVSNVVVGDSLVEVVEVVGDAIEVTEETGPANIGDIYNAESGVFSAPTEG